MRILATSISNEIMHYKRKSQFTDDNTEQGRVAVGMYGDTSR